jgi:hypothetical protein
MKKIHLNRALAAKKKIFLFVYVAVVLAACMAKKPTEEQAIRSMCEEIVQRYPQATLQDVYKTCFQAFFGAEHLLSDTAAAHQYLKAEIAATEVQDLSAMPKYEPTGFRHRFMRANLSLVHSGEMSEDELFARFAEAAGTNNAFSDKWEEEWQTIETIALEVQPTWADSTLQNELRYAASVQSPVRHSETFRQAYHPHYRIIVNQH